jgi:hypothetical protein
VPGKAARDDKSADCEKEKNGEIWRHIKPQEIAEKNLGNVPDEDDGRLYATRRIRPITKLGPQ